MHPSVLAKRKAMAVNRIVARATALVQYLELDPTLAEALEPKATRDPATVDMLRMEALATLIDHVALNAGVPEEEQPDTSVGEFIVEPVTAVTPVEDETGPEAIPTDVPDEVESAAEAVEETESPEKPKRASSKKNKSRS